MLPSPREKYPRLHCGTYDFDGDEKRVESIVADTAKRCPIPEEFHATRGHMPELKGQKCQQPSSRPDGWLPAVVVVQLERTGRQQRYAQRCVGIAPLRLQPHGGQRPGHT